ncbi:MAG: hypothetical protein ABI266_05860, partial [Ginsengibacter sp.]
MSKILITLFFCFVLTGFHNISFAQVKPDSTELPTVVEEQLENLTESNEDNTTEDDSYLQDINYFVKHPLNLNYADQGLLEQLQLLTPVQISNLLSYRKLFGNLISIYELQAIPTWNVSMIKRILPYITVSENLNVFKSLKSRFKDGSTTVLLRGTQILEDQKGYILNKDSVQNFYPGSPQKVLLRYKYKFGNLLQYGFTAEKDGGEQFFKGAQKKGFDFYSAHLFIRNLGVIKALALGDFVINMGQGLTQWQSLSFSRGALSAKRQSDVLRPYNSAGEVTFNRGIGITLQKKNWEATGFASYRRLDASFNVDTLNFEDYISSLYNTGFHRTANEVAGRNTQGQLSLGGNVSYSTSQFHIGANAIHYDFEHTIQKASLLYNKYAISGKQLGNYSVDYSFTYRNMHFFGEAAVDNTTDYAFVNGLALSVNSKVDMSFLYRKISPQYQSLYTSAFTEST